MERVDAIARALGATRDDVVGELLRAMGVDRCARRARARRFGSVRVGSVRDD
jgi:hypothetical protein